MTLLKKVLLISILVSVLIFLYTKLAYQIPESSNWDDGSLKTITTALNTSGKPAFFPAFRVRYFTLGSKDSTKFCKQEEYYLSGRLSEQGTYDNQGRKHGKWEQWYPDGQQALIESYRHGVKHGSWITWLHDGSLSEHLTFESGQINRVVTRARK